MKIARQLKFKRFFFVFIIFYVIIVQCSCTKLKEKEVKILSTPIPVDPQVVLLENILSMSDSVFTNTIGESNALAQKILENKEDFLRDLDIVMKANTDDLLILADKKNYLSKDYIPSDLVNLKPNNAYLLNRNDLSLRIPVEKALTEMALAAQKDDVKIVVSSTYRSYDYQDALYQRNVKQLGKEVADRESARPGTSQHQLGTAIDFGSITDEFAQTKAGIWLNDNAGVYGFSLSFLQGYESVTGYRWESWHFRYIGKEAVSFQKKWFNNVQQYMIEFIHCWNNCL